LMPDKEEEGDIHWILLLVIIINIIIVSIKCGGILPPHIFLLLTNIESSNNVLLFVSSRRSVTVIVSMQRGLFRGLVCSSGVFDHIIENDIKCTFLHFFFVITIIILVISHY